MNKRRARPRKSLRKEGTSRPDRLRKKTEQPPVLHPAGAHGSASGLPIQISPTKQSHAGAGRSSSVFWLPSSRAFRHFRSACKNSPLLTLRCFATSRPIIFRAYHTLTTTTTNNPPPHLPYYHHDLFFHHHHHHYHHQHPPFRPDERRSTTHLTHPPHHATKTRSIRRGSDIIRLLP